MSEKIDLIDFQKKFQDQYGLIDQDMARIRKSAILTFFSSDDGKIMAKLAGGGVVFRHKEGGMQISPGETWVCELMERGTTFFAMGILKLDAKTFLDLRSDQVDHLAEVVWEKNRTILTPGFEQKYLKSMQEMVDRKLGESKAREESASSRIEELKSELESMKLKDKMVIAALEKELLETREMLIQGAKIKPETSIETSGPSNFAPTHPRIRRIGPDELQSDDFLHRNYFVHLSADRSMMTVRPHDRGNIVCVDKKIVLNGLALISPFEGQGDMPAEYSPKFGGYVVLLR